MKNISQYYAGESDAREYQIKQNVFSVLIFLCFAAFVADYLNVWLMSVIVSVLVTRWMISFHELFHLRRPEELGYMTRLQIIPFAPFNLGYREYRTIHFGHHQYTAMTKDPDAFHILGGHIKAFIGAITQHEQAVFRYIAANGLSYELTVMMALRLIIFILLLSLFPVKFLIWWLVLRTTYIINDFVFFHLVHYRSGESGTFSIPLPTFMIYPLIFIYGVDVVYATMHHDTHHAYPRIAAKYLAKVSRA